MRTRISCLRVIVLTSLVIGIVHGAVELGWGQTQAEPASPNGADVAVATDAATEVPSSTGEPANEVAAASAAEPDQHPLQVWLRETLGPPLKSIHAPVDRWLGTLPMSVAVSCAIGLYVVAVIWVWFLKRDFVFRGAPDNQWWRDLRIWATLVTVPYIVVYLILGR